MSNVLLLYIPLFVVIVGGISITIWAVTRLKQRILEETWELRLGVLRRQITIVSIFTINYIISGCLFLPIVLVTFTSTKHDYDSKWVPYPQLVSFSKSAWDFLW